MLSIFTYQFALQNTFKTAIGSFNHREGIYLSVVYNHNYYLGEVSPLPGFSDDSLTYCLQYVTKKRERIELEIRQKIQWISSQFYDSYFNHTSFEDCFELMEIECTSLNHPSNVRFAIDCIVLQHLCNLITNSSNNDATDTHESVISNTNPTIGDEIQTAVPTSSSVKVSVENLLKKPIPVNITTNNPEQINGFYDDGFRVFKFKAGMNSELDLNFVKMIREKYPDITIRIDANAAWSLDEARTELKNYSPLGIEYIEQPIPTEDLIKHGHHLGSLGIPIAADETARTLNDVLRIVEHHAAEVLIIKPAMIGSISELLRIRNLANEHKIKIIITTSLDSGPGRQLTALITSLFFNDGNAHGLATGYMYSEDILTDVNQIVNGFYYPILLDYSKSTDLSGHPMIKVVLS